MTHYDDERARYMRAAHRIQSGTAMLIELEPKLVEPKHIRVGIDMSKSDQLGLARLLIAKGIISEDEYITAMADAAEIEARDLAELLSLKLGSEITLI